MAAVAVHSSREMPTDTAAATVESELSPTTPVCSPLHDGSLRLHPMTMCCICTTVSLQSVSGRGRGAKTDLEQTMRRTPPSAPYLWIAGLSTRTSAESETLSSRYLQTGEASRACKLQPGRGMRNSSILCPISRTSTDQVIQDLASMQGSLSTTYVPATNTVSPTCFCTARHQRI